MSDLEEKKRSVVALFDKFYSDEDKYFYLCYLGKQLTSLSSQKKIDRYLLPGCQTKVWIDHYYSAQVICFEAACDSLIIAGLIKTIFLVYDKSRPEDIIKDPMNILTLIKCNNWLTNMRINHIGRIISYISTQANIIYNAEFDIKV